MKIWIGSAIVMYGMELVALVILIWLGYRYFDRRYLGNRRERSKLDSLSGNLRPTGEVFVDPKSGKKYRVYFNDKTGERDYVEEP